MFTDGGKRTLNGIIPKLLHSIFTQIKSMESELIQYQVRMSFIEIYNNRATDLLDKLLSKSVPSSAGYVECPIKSTKNAMNLISVGSKSRHTRETDMNTHSSRSHAIVTLYLEKRSREDKGSRKFTNQISKFNLVDLAGSESIEKSGSIRCTEGLREAASINTGLLVLHRVLSALQSNTSGHIPYRDHILTQLLQSSIGGDSYSLFLAHISPLNYNMYESLSTISYAQRAMSVYNSPTLHIEENEEEITSFDDDIIDPSELNRRSCFLSTKR